MRPSGSSLERWPRVAGMSLTAESGGCWTVIVTATECPSWDAKLEGVS